MIESKAGNPTGKNNWEFIMGSEVEFEPLRLRGFRVGPWAVHPQAGQLRQGDHAVHVEPKVMEVLLCLAARPAAVVTRDCILTAVWPNVVVNEEVLTRAVSELRSLLGDTARERCYIKTVPKRGYSLIAPVEPLPAAGAHPARTSAAPGNEANPWRWVNALAGSGRRAVHRTAVAVGYLGLVFVAGGALWNSSFEQPTAGADASLVQRTAPSRLEQVAFQPQANTHLRVAVLPFAVLTENPESVALASGINEDLRVSLSRRAGLQVAGGRLSEKYRNTNPSKAQLGEALGVDLLVQGTVRRFGSSFRATVEVLSVSTGFVVWANRYDDNDGDMLALPSRIADDVTAQFTGRPYGGQQTESAGTEAPATDVSPLYGDAHTSAWPALS